MTDNVTQYELDKFAKLAKHWWDKTGELRTLHEINPVRLEFIQQHTQLAGLKALDIGCGGGILTEALATAGATVTALDAEPEVIAVAKQHAQEHNLTIDYQCLTAEEFSAQHHQAFDVITCMELLEHVPKPAELINTCRGMLKPGGKLFLSTINRTVKAYTFAILGAEYLLKIIPKHTHDYEKFIKPSELAAWLRDEGLSLIDLKGMQYNPLLRSCNLTDNVEINYLMVAKS